MNLPIRTTVNDIEMMCAYLATKPTGATGPEAKAVLDPKVLDGRKISAFKFWGLIDDTGGKMLLTEAGRRLAKDKFANRAGVMRGVIGRIPPYKAIVERSVHSAEMTVTGNEVASHWHQHFKGEVSNSDRLLNDQAICFFQFAEGADLGKLVIGRKGQPTRFEFDHGNASRFVEGRDSSADAATVEDRIFEEESSTSAAAVSQVASPASIEQATVDGKKQQRNKVFITHGKNKKILAQVKEIVAFGKFEPVVAQERETAAKPVPEKVMDDMRACQFAVIHVGAEGVLSDKHGNEYPQINGNVLIEIGAAMALYRRNFILLVEEGVQLPSNLQGLYECRYKGDELSGEATMKLLKGFNAFE